MTLVEAIADAGIEDERVLDAFARTARESFIAATDADLADEDVALSIGRNHMSPQPSILARILELAEVSPGHRVLEIGAGSGYLTALLNHLGAEVAPVESQPRLARRTERLTGVAVRVADGHHGWPERAPFDRIIATASVSEVPPAWLSQLAEGGRIVCPLGRTYQHLTVIHHHGERVRDLAVDFETLGRIG